MAINIIYPPDGYTAWDHAAALIAHIDEFYKKFNAADVLVDDNVMLELSAALAAAKANFPHKFGYDKASPFKKIAYFFCLFVEMKPIINVTFEPGTEIDAEITGVPNYLNTVYAFNVACRRLHGAQLRKKNGVTMLEKRIAVSRHTYCDVIDACAKGVAASTHYKTMALLFEMLAYRANPDASDPLMCC